MTSQLTSKVKKTLKISNIIAKSQLVPPFSLSSLSAEFPFTPQPTLARIPISHNRTKFSIFKTGTVISRGSPSFLDLNASVQWLQSLLRSFGLNLSDKYVVLNIVASAQLFPFRLNLYPLAEFLPHSSYDPSPISSYEFLVNAITFYFSPESKPRRTALIFPTGKATLTGFNSLSDLKKHARQLSSLLNQISHEHPEVVLNKNKNK